MELSDGLDEAIRAARREERVVVAAGGDGTVHTVVQHLEAEDLLGVLPAGTLNHFASDLGLDDASVALDVLEAGQPRTVDLGKVNGERFVNNVSLGLYPEVVRDRERLEDRMGKWPAMVVAAATAAVRTAPVHGSISADGDARQVHAWVVFVGNNRFEVSAGRVGSRERLDEGALDLWVLTAKPRSRAGTRGWHAWNGSGPAGRRVRTQARAVDISLREARHIAADGEDLGVVQELALRSLPGALRVLAPR